MNRNHISVGRMSGNSGTILGVAGAAWAMEGNCLMQVCLAGVVQGAFFRYWLSNQGRSGCEDDSTMDADRSCRYDNP